MIFSPWIPETLRRNTGKQKRIKITIFAFMSGTKRYNSSPIIAAQTMLIMATE